MKKHCQMKILLSFALIGTQSILLEAYCIGGRYRRTLFQTFSFLSESPRTIGRKSITSLLAYGDAVLADEEPLSSKFQRAVVLQRAGDHESALKEYETFVKAAKQCDVSPATYAEVHVNMGAIYTKMKRRGEARKNFEIALEFRELGSAHVNLALLTLSEGRLSTDPKVIKQSLNDAKNNCEKAIRINDDVSSVNSARRLLGDIKKMLDQVGGTS